MYLSSILLSYTVVAVCTFTEPNYERMCYDMLFESDTIIRCENRPYSPEEPYPWDWYSGNITLGYTDSVTGKFVVNYKFFFDWGTWDVVTGNYVNYVVGVNSDTISRSGFDETCWTRKE